MKSKNSISGSVCQMMEAGGILDVAVDVYSSLYAKSKSKLAIHPIDLKTAKKARDGSHSDNFGENL